MGYTTVADRRDAVEAAALLAIADASPPRSADAVCDALPLLVDQVMAESGFIEPVLCARALEQAYGDVARAVSLVRAWGAMLPRLAVARAAIGDMHVTRRITPGFSQPAGGQYLGASLDYAARLLDLGNGRAAATNGRASGALADPAPSTFPPAYAPLAQEGLIAAPRRAATAVDLTRVRDGRRSRGAFLQLLARAESGAMTALAYTAIRGYGQRQDPTLLDFRAGAIPIRIERPGGGPFVVGSIEATIAEVVLYRLHDDGSADAHLTLGVGATPGRLERRAIAAAMLDAGVERACSDADAKRAPCDDEEFLSVALDGQEATGFVEHLKLPHYVTFTSDLDRVRAQNPEHA